MPLLLVPSAERVSRGLSVLATNVNTSVLVCADASVRTENVGDSWMPSSASVKSAAFSVAVSGTVSRSNESAYLPFVESSKAKATLTFPA